MPLNYAKTALLLAALTGILVAMGGAVGGQTGIVVAFVAAAIMNGLALWKSDQFVLRMQGAQEIDAQTGGRYYAIVRDLAQRAELPMPRVCVVHAPQPNAFATGRSPSHAAVVASTGLLEMLSAEEIAGVMAHELSHIKNRDTLTMALAATLGGAISMLAQWLQVSFIFGNRPSGGRSRFTTLAAALLAPFAAMLVQMAVSRSREYQADRLGGMLCGNPNWLAGALVKIHNAVRGGAPNPAIEQAPAMAHLFIINPLTGRGMDSLFASHPSTENRVAALQRLAAEMGIGGADLEPGVPPGNAGSVPVTGSPRPRGIWG